jgi:hypothetical protein
MYRSLTVFPHRRADLHEVALLARATERIKGQGEAGESSWQPQETPVNVSVPKI